MRKNEIVSVESTTKFNDQQTTSFTEVISSTTITPADSINGNTATLNRDGQQHTEYAIEATEVTSTDSVSETTNVIDFDTKEAAQTTDNYIEFQTPKSIVWADETNNIVTDETKTEVPQGRESVTETTEIEEPVTTLSPLSEENITTYPEITTEARDPDVPQPELVKEARRQDIEKPSGNLFRPIPFRARPRTPKPTKLDDSVDLKTFVQSNAPFPNPSFGIGQRQPLFPPPTFFNQQLFGQPQFFSQVPHVNHQTTLINGRPVAIQSQAQFPFPPEIRLKEHFPQGETVFLPPQPHLDHLFQFQDQKQHVIDARIPLPSDPLLLPEVAHQIEQKLENNFHNQNNEIIPVEELPSYSLSVIPDHVETSKNDIPLSLFTTEKSLPVHLEDQTITKPVIHKETLIDEAAANNPLRTSQLQNINVLPKQEHIDRPQETINPQKTITPTPPVLTTVVPSAIPFSHYPPPHDLCFKQGLRADPFRCPIFHECILEANQWQVYTWRCPRGKYFDESSSTCIKGYC